TSLPGGSRVRRAAARLVAACADRRGHALGGLVDVPPILIADCGFVGQSAICNLKSKIHLSLPGQGHARDRGIDAQTDQRDRILVVALAIDLDAARRYGQPLLVVQAQHDLAVDGLHIAKDDPVYLRLQPRRLAFEDERPWPLEREQYPLP